MRITYILATAFFLALAVPNIAAAGNTLEYKTERAVIAVYLSETPSPATAVPITLNVIDYAGNALAYESVWMRITKGRDTVFSGELHGPLTYQFPGIGDYEMYLRFSRHNATLAEHTFPIAVAAKGSAQAIPVINYFVALLVGVGGGVVARSVRTFGGS